MNEIDEVGLEVRNFLRRLHAMVADALLCAESAARLVCREHIDKDLRGLLRGALILVDDGKCLALEPLPLSIVAEEAQGLACQFRTARDRYNGVAVAEECVDVLEIKHLTADDDRLAVRRRLQNIMSAVRDQAAADVDDISEPINAPELADRIEDDDILAARSTLLQVLSRIDGKARLAAEMLHLHRAQHLTRRDDEPHVRIFCTHGGKGSEHQLLFAAMRRACDHDAARALQAELLDERGPFLRADTRIRLIELRIARDCDELTRRAEAHDVVRVDARLHGEAFHRSDHLAQHAEQILILLDAAVADAPVDHHDRNIQLFCLLEKVRPKLRLHGQEYARANAPHNA